MTGGVLDVVWWELLLVRTSYVVNKARKFKCVFLGVYFINCVFV